MSYYLEKSKHPEMTAAVQRFGAGGAIDFPQDAAGEIGVLARAFTAMATETRRFAMMSFTAASRLPCTWYS